MSRESHPLVFFEHRGFEYLCKKSDSVNETPLSNKNCKFRTRSLFRFCVFLRMLRRKKRCTRPIYVST